MSTTMSRCAVPSPFTSAARGGLRTRMRSLLPPRPQPLTLLLVLLLLVALVAVPSSPALVAAQIIPGFGAPLKIAMAEKAALLAFAKAMGNHPAFRWGGWANVSLGLTYEMSRPCVQNWRFITCNVNGRVNGISMSFYELSSINPRWPPLRGVIPWRQMLPLQDLGSLSLSANQIRGGISPLVSSFKRMESMFLDYNQMDGPIPATIGQLPILKTLYLTNNMFAGSLPASVGNLRTLSRLDVSSNSLSGPFLPVLGLLVNLDVLDIGSNAFAGALPPGWSRLTRLRILNLQNTRVASSGVPAAWRAMRSLQHFVMTSAQYKGPFPTPISQLPKIKDIMVFGNQMYGTLPAALWKSPQLTMIDVSNNFLKGAVVKPPPARMATFRYFGNCLTLSRADARAQPQLLTSTCNSFYGSLPK